MLQSATTSTEIHWTSPNYPRVQVSMHTIDHDVRKHQLFVIENLNLEHWGVCHDISLLDHACYSGLS